MYRIRASSDPNVLLEESEPETTPGPSPIQGPSPIHGASATQAPEVDITITQEEEEEEELRLLPVDSGLRRFSPPPEFATEPKRPRTPQSPQRKLAVAAPPEGVELFVPEAKSTPSPSPTGSFKFFGGLRSHRSSQGSLPVPGRATPVSSRGSPRLSPGFPSVSPRGSPHPSPGPTFRESQSPRFQFPGRTTPLTPRSSPRPSPSSLRLSPGFPSGSPRSSPRPSPVSASPRSPSPRFQFPGGSTEPEREELVHITSL